MMIISTAKAAPQTHNRNPCDMHPHCTHIRAEHHISYDFPHEWCVRYWRGSFNTFSKLIFIILYIKCYTLNLYWTPLFIIFIVVFEVFSYFFYTNNDHHLAAHTSFSLALRSLAVVVVALRWYFVMFSFGFCCSQINCALNFTSHDNYINNNRIPLWSTAILMSEWLFVYWIRAVGCVFKLNTFRMRKWVKQNTFHTSQYLIN